MPVVRTFDEPFHVFGYHTNKPKDIGIKLAAALPIIGQIIGIVRIALSFLLPNLTENEKKLYRLRGFLEILNLGLLLIPFDIWLRYTPTVWVPPDIKHD